MLLMFKTLYDHVDHIVDFALFRYFLKFSMRCVSHTSKFSKKLHNNCVCTHAYDFIINTSNCNVNRTIQYAVLYIKIET